MEEIVSKIENSLASVINQADLQIKDPRVSPEDKSHLKERRNLAVNLLGYIQKLQESEGTEHMIKGLVLRRLTKRELPKRQRKPSELETTILELCNALEQEEDPDFGGYLIDPQLMSQASAQVKLGKLVKAGKLPDGRYGFSKSEEGFVIKIKEGSTKKKVKNVA